MNKNRIIVLAAIGVVALVAIGALLILPTLRDGEKGTGGGGGSEPPVAVEGAPVAELKDLAVGEQDLSQLSELQLAQISAANESLPEEQRPTEEQLRDQATSASLQQLVTMMVIQAYAKEQGIPYATEDEVDARVDQFKQQFAAITPPVEADGEGSAEPSAPGELSDEDWQNQLSALGMTEQSMRWQAATAIQFEKLVNKEVGESTEPTEAELKKAYEDNAAAYEMPTSRTVSLVVMPDDSDQAKKRAETIAKELNEGKKIDQIVADRGEEIAGAQADYTLAETILPEDDRKKVFVENDGTAVVSKVSSQYWVILPTGKVEAGKQMPFEDIRDSLRMQLLQGQWLNAVSEIVAKAGDQLLPEIVWADEELKALMPDTLAGGWQSSFFQPPMLNPTAQQGGQGDGAGDAADGDAS